MGSAPEPEDDVLDVVIVGAGLSGINSAYRLHEALPDVRYAVLEARDCIGGTWAFWKYPGARSDSSLGVFRLAWHPWPSDRDFADAAVIRDYLADAARVHGIDRHIRFGHRVEAQRWSTAAQLWTLEVAVAGTTTTTTTTTLRARWVVNCGGYYSYERARASPIPGLDRFRGEVAHPQFWTDAQSVDGKRVVLVGSGATAITMLPHVARRAAHTTLLQRSPSYVLALPRRNGLSALLRRLLPRRAADAVAWAAEMVQESLFIALMRRFPRAGGRLLRRLARAQLPPGYPVDVHFAPRYGPFEQRLCLCPDGDFFQALHQPNCAIVTGVVDTVTADGVRVLAQTAAEAPDGDADGVPSTSQPVDIPADMIITATGLQVELLNGRTPEVDGVAVRLGDRFVWRGTMLEGVPNACFVIGYTLGTWTPGADVHFQTVLAVLRAMRRRGATAATPTVAGGAAARARMPRLPAMHGSATYLAAVADALPKSAGRYPWLSGQTYAEDVWYNWTGSPDDGMVYTVPDKKTV